MYVWHCHLPDQARLDSVAVSGCCHMVEDVQRMERREVEDVDSEIEEDRRREDLGEGGFVVAEDSISCLGRDTEKDRRFAQCSD